MGMTYKLKFIHKLSKTDKENLANAIRTKNPTLYRSNIYREESHLPLWDILNWYDLSILYGVFWNDLYYNRAKPTDKDWKILERTAIEQGIYQKKDPITDPSYKDLWV